MKAVLALFNIITCTLFLVACGGSSGGSSGPEVEENQDLGDETFYSFDEEKGSIAFNSSFVGHNGVISAAQRVDGKVNRALYFGSDLPSYVEFPGVSGNQSPFRVQFINNEISLESWIKFETLDTDKKYHYFGEGPFGIRTFKIEVIDGQFVFTLYTDSSGVDSIELIRSDEVFGVDTWYYIAFTYNGSEAKVYINGELNRQVNLSAGIFPVVNSQYLGGVPRGTGATSFPGYIDEFRFTVRERSQQEILNYFETTK